MNEKSPFDHPESAQTPSNEVRIESIFGNIPQVTADPTWTPKRMMDGFAMGNISGTRKLYIYDFVAGAWYKVSLTVV